MSDLDDERTVDAAEDIEPGFFVGDGVNWGDTAANEVAELVEGLDTDDLFGSGVGREAFTEGMGVELARDLRGVVSDKSLGESDGYLSAASSPPDVAAIEQVEVDDQQAERLLKAIYSKLNAFQLEYDVLPEQLVLGVPQFTAVEAYLREQHDKTAEQRLPVESIIVVPGPQIHCVRDKYDMVEADSDAE